MRENTLYQEVLKHSRILDIGVRRVVRVARNYRDGKPRFAINLPTTRNDLWAILWENKVPIKLFIEIPQEIDKKRQD